MNSVRSGVAKVLTSAVMAGQAFSLTPSSAGEKKVDQPSTGIVSRNSDRNPDTVELSTNKQITEEANSEMVQLKSGQFVPKEEYFDLVIKNATKDGILKSKDGFKLKDLQGREIEDTQGYKKYIDSLKGKANQFKDPKDFSRFINTIRFLRDTPGSAKAVLTPRQVEFLVEHPSVDEVAHLIKKLNGGITIDGISIHQARIEADESIRKLEESILRSVTASNK